MHQLPPAIGGSDIDSLTLLACPGGAEQAQAEPELGCQPREMVRAPGSRWAPAGTGHRACRAARTHTAAVSFVWLLKLIQMKFLKRSAAHSHLPHFECSTGTWG